MIEIGYGKYIPVRYYIFATLDAGIVYISNSGTMCSCNENIATVYRTCIHTDIFNQLYSYETSFSTTNGLGLILYSKNSGKKWSISLDKLKPNEEILSISTINEKNNFILSIISPPKEIKEQDNTSAVVTILNKGNINEIGIDDYKKSRNITIKIKDN